MRILSSGTKLLIEIGCEYLQKSRRRLASFSSRWNNPSSDSPRFREIRYLMIIHRRSIDRLQDVSRQRLDIAGSFGRDLADCRHKKCLMVGDALFHIPEKALFYFKEAVLIVASSQALMRVMTSASMPK